MKANPKLKAEPKAEAAAPANSKKKLIVIVAAVAVLAAAGGGGAWFMLKGGGDHEEAPAKTKSKKNQKSGPPTYVTVDPFTVNLQPETEQDQYLQLAFTLQVEGLEDSESIKNNMAKVRSRVLLLLSGKRASEINTPEGKQQLAKEIMAQINEPFENKGSEQEVTEVLFTSFIIQ
ncbi:flagellar basal body-associated protein FliL [Pseudoduganella namucuonensis]|uniref:Flagellar protein FliL n=1 Tax=Pseudoduganella namucuonensis TaxID=1035707 RepID=A0A1I7KZS6_9BURK|nr:flagellar basal body-associated protein FliL [Pseudoduganella namucuonensis]SFV02951.1 flagellar FliL protein [Pseudoduganella namucuonensis]